MPAFRRSNDEIRFDTALLQVPISGFSLSFVDPEGTIQVLKGCLTDVNLAGRMLTH
jgi:hypothetical protein